MEGLPKSGCRGEPQAYHENMTYEPSGELAAGTKAYMSCSLHARAHNYYICSRELGCLETEHM
jgi:hypothetical protein